MTFVLLVGGAVVGASVLAGVIVLAAEGPHAPSSENESVPDKRYRLVLWPVVFVLSVLAGVAFARYCGQPPAPTEPDPNFGSHAVPP